MSEQIENLPTLLMLHAVQHPHTIAIRHKYLGLWQKYSWQALLERTQQISFALQHYGFQKGHSFLLVSRPQVNVMALSLAIQALGGIVKLIDHHHELPSSQQLGNYIDLIKPDYVFLEQCLEIGDFERLAHIPQYIFYDQTSDDQISAYKNIVDVTGLLTNINSADRIELNTDQIVDTDIAFSFEQLDETGVLVSAVYTHRHLIDEAKKLAEYHHINQEEEALIARAFSSVAHIRYLWAVWLLQGFSLNIPETLATRDQDRQIIAPTLVLGTPETYHRIWQLIVQRLPKENSWLAKLYKNALAKKLAQKKNNLIEQFILGLFKQVILEELGFSRLKTALIVGQHIDPTVEQFLKGLDISLEAWGENTIWNTATEKQNPSDLTSVLSSIG